MSIKAGAHRIHDPALAGAVLRVPLRAIRTALRRGSPGAGPDAQLGAVSFLHRFGAALNPHFHFHLVVLDGVFTETDGDLRCHEATHFSADDAKALAPVSTRNPAPAPLATTLDPALPPRPSYRK